MAPSATHSAHIFCGRVTNLAASNKLRRLDVAFSRAIAHELGHLVLPGLGHADTGVMRGALDLKSDETPHFTEGQGASIRSYLISRNEHLGR